MNDRQPIPEMLVTPEEAVELMRHVPITFLLNPLPIVNAYWQKYGPGNHACMDIMLGAVWYAGRIQGIREERKRRKGE